jgi:hypothetical protein
MEQIGKGNPEQGQIKWEEGALAEVKQCAKSPQVAVIEILNEPWALRNSPTGMSGAEYVANGELYGRMLKGLLERVNASGLEGKVTLLASGLVAEKGQRHVAPEAWKQLWLEPLVRGGGEELQKYIGGLDFHPYGKAKGNKIPVQLEGMQVQYQYITENNPAAHLPWAHPELYVTEYNYYKAIKDNESPGAEDKEKVETQKMFHRLKTEVPGVKGIWFFNYIDAGCKHWGWYAEPCLKGNPVKSQEPIEWAKVRPVRGVVEACAKEEKKREEGVLNPEESEC